MSQNEMSLPATLDEVLFLLGAQPDPAQQFDRLHNELCGNLNAQNLLTVCNQLNRIQVAAARLQCGALDLMQQQFDFIEHVNDHQG